MKQMMDGPDGDELYSAHPVPVNVMDLIHSYDGWFNA